MAKIVAATGSSVATRTVSARAIEDAMIEAVLQCARDGITDEKEILRRKLAARERIKIAPEK